MQVCNRIPAHRHHFCRCIELHGARAKRDHRTIKRQILVGQTTQEAHHLGFRTVRMEHVLREETFAAPLAGNESFVAIDRLGTEQNGECCKIFLGRGFVKGDTNCIRINDAEQTTALVGFVGNLRSLTGNFNRYRIKQAITCDLDTSSLEASRKACSKAGHACSNSLQSCRAMPDSERCRHIGKQRLRGADVRRGLVATDMLFTGLERQTIGRTTMRIDRLTDDAARNDAGQRLRHRQIRGVRAAEAHRNAITLHGAYSHVGTPAGRRFHNGQRQRIGNGDDEGALGFRIGDDLAEIAIDTTRIRPRHDDGSGIVIDSAASFDLPAERFGAGVDHIDGLWVQFTCKQNTAALVAVVTTSNADGFSNRSRFIQERCAGNRQTGQFRNQRLKVEKKLKTTLADFRLVRRISRVPGRILKQVALNDGWRFHTMIARADEALLHHIAAHDFIELRKCCMFAQSGWQIERAIQTNGCWNRLGDKGFHGRKAERCKHCALVFQSWPDMTGNKGKNLLRHLFILPVCRNRPCQGDRRAGLRRKASA